MERACYPLPPPHPLQRRPRRPSPSCWRTRSGGATRPSSPSPSSSPPASTSWSTSSSRWATTTCLSNSYFNELSDPERCHLQLPHLSSHRGSLTGGNNTFSRSNKLIHPLSLSLFFTLTFYLSLHLLLSWRSQPTRRTWPPPSTSSSSPSRSSTHASSSTQSSAQSEHEKFFFILVKIPTSSPGDQQPKANRPKAPVITNFYYSNLGANKLYL